MKVMLNDAEIKIALVNYVVGQGIDISGKDVNVDMTAGRGENGFSANIDIVDASLESVETEVSGTDDVSPLPADDAPNGVASEEEPDDSTNLFPTPAE